MNALQAYHGKWKRFHALSFRRCIRARDLVGAKFALNLALLHRDIQAAVERVRFTRISPEENARTKFSAVVEWTGKEAA